MAATSASEAAQSRIIIARFSFRQTATGARGTSLLEYDYAARAVARQADAWKLYLRGRCPRDPCKILAIEGAMVAIEQNGEVFIWSPERPFWHATPDLISRESTPAGAQLLRATDGDRVYTFALSGGSTMSASEFTLATDAVRHFAISFDPDFAMAREESADATANTSTQNETDLRAARDVFLPRARSEGAGGYHAIVSRGVAYIMRAARVSPCSYLEFCCADITAGSCGCARRMPVLVGEVDAEAASKMCICDDRLWVALADPAKADRALADPAKTDRAPLIDSAPTNLAPAVRESGHREIIFSIDIAQPDARWERYGVAVPPRVRRVVGIAARAGWLHLLCEMFPRATILASGRETHRVLSREISNRDGEWVKSAPVEDVCAGAIFEVVDARANDDGAQTDIQRDV
jgi:hypothetical protein